MRCEQEEEENAEVEQIDLDVEGTPSENKAVKEIHGIFK